MTLIKTCSCRKTVGTKHFPSPLTEPYSQGRKTWSQIRRDPNLSPPDSSREGPFIVIPKIPRRRDKHYKLCQVVPKPIPSFKDSLGGLTRQRIYICSHICDPWQWKMRSSGKGAWNQVWRKPGMRFWIPCSGAPQTAHASGTELWQHLWRGVL